MEIAWPAIVAASLVGSMHCAGMCGPLMAVVMSKPGGDQPGPSSRALLASYHGARGAGYMALGALAGGLGQLADLVGVLAGLTPLAASLAALTLVVSGLVLLARHLGARIPKVALPKRFLAGVQGLQGRAFRLPPTTRALAIGALTALLPCGWLYAFATVAAGTASPWLGALVMAAFWVGSVPILSAVGLGVRGVGGRIGPRLRPALSAILIGVGLWGLVGRASLDSLALVRHVEASGVNLSGAGPPMDEPLPCCDGGAGGEQ